MVVCVIDVQVSPVPDVYVYDLHKHKEQFVVLASDGLWNMIRPQEAVSIVAAVEGKQSRGVCFVCACLFPYNSWLHIDIYN